MVVWLAWPLSFKPAFKLLDQVQCHAAESTVAILGCHHRHRPSQGAGCHRTGRAAVSFPAFQKRYCATMHPSPPRCRCDGEREESESLVGCIYLARDVGRERSRCTHVCVVVCLRFGEAVWGGKTVCEGFESTIAWIDAFSSVRFRRMCIKTSWRFDWSNFSSDSNSIKKVLKTIKNPKIFYFGFMTVLQTSLIQFDQKL